MKMKTFDPAGLPEAMALLREAFQREDSDPRNNEWELAKSLLEDPGYLEELCLVAQEGGRTVGYIALTRAQLGGTQGAALAPLAVAEECRNQGIGSALVEESLKRARAMGEPWVIVLGGPYYARFGFEPARRYGVTVSDNSFENEHLQILFLTGGPRPSGRAVYCRSFYDKDGNLL